MVRAITPRQDRRKERKFFDDMNAWAQSEGFAGLGYATRKGGEWGGPIAKEPWRGQDERDGRRAGPGADDGLFFAAGKEAQAAKLAVWRAPASPTSSA